MRVSVFLLCCFCAATLHGADGRPRVDGRAGSVSKADIQAITIAAKLWLVTRDPDRKADAKLPLIHVVDQNKTEVHVTTCNDGWLVEMLLTFRRVNGRWKADDWAKIITLLGC
jgi:hypothetical protein